MVLLAKNEHCAIMLLRGTAACWSAGALKRLLNLCRK